MKVTAKITVRDDGVVLDVDYGTPYKVPEGHTVEVNRLCCTAPDVEWYIVGPAGEQKIDISHKEFYDWLLQRITQSPQNSPDQFSPQS